MSRIREYYLEDKEEFLTESISNTPPPNYTSRKGIGLAV